jgi:hypothetical protein
LETSGLELSEPLTKESVNRKGRKHNGAFKRDTHDNPDFSIFEGEKEELARNMLKW